MCAKMNIQVNCKLGSIYLRLNTILNESYDFADMGKLRC